MVKTKKNKVKKISQRDFASIRFEIEPDAEAIFLQHLESIDADIVAERGSAEVEEKAPNSRKNLKKAKDPSFEVDLHGFTVAQAKEEIKRVIADVALSQGVFTFRVITGKGKHSGPEGGVLSGAIHQFVLDYYREQVVRIDEAPSKITLGGLPFRGYFDVSLKLRT
jgi:DNA-nicking Smr family endonuclease